MKSLPFTLAGHNFTRDVSFGFWVFLTLAQLCFNRLYHRFSPFFQQEAVCIIECIIFLSSLSDRWLITLPFIRDGKKHAEKRCWKPKVIISPTHGGLFSLLSILRGQESFKILFLWFRLLVLYPFTIPSNNFST